VKRPLAPLGRSQGVAHAALAGPEELARHSGRASLARLGSNESPYGPSPKAIAAADAAAAHSNRYGDPGNFELRGALAAYHGIDSANVMVGAGIDDLLGIAVRAFLPPGGAAIAGLGAFPTFEMHVRGFDAQLERVPYRADGRTDLAGFLAAAQRLPGGLIFLPNPDNPSGSYYPPRDVMAFLDALPDDWLVLHDEAYANFLPPEERFPDDALDPRMLRLRTFSKEYGLAGMRVGYAFGSTEAVAALDALRLLYGVSRPAQAAALAALEDWPYVTDVIERLRAGRAAYHALGARLGLATLPSATNFVLFDLGSLERAQTTLNGLLERGIHVRKPPAPPLDRYVRISVGTPHEHDLLAAALEAILVAR
jgi:histidinol-phosphate aminotransferase